MSNTGRRLRVGIIGAGEVAQVIHLPVLSLMSEWYEATIVCDISQKTAEHCAKKFHLRNGATTKPQEVFNSPDVDVVFVLTSDEFHEEYSIGALKAGKHVFIEKPVTLSVQSVQRMMDAEKKANGPKVFVGYMRRYAQAFTQAFKREIANIERITYARVRDFPGPNPRFVAESGAFPVKNNDYRTNAANERDQRLDKLFDEAFPGQEKTDERVLFWRFMGTLGSHDISLMREALGFPDSVSSVSVNDPMYGATFRYNQQPSGSKHPFSVTYESGWDDVPVFDAHVAVYGDRKRVWIEYDSPFVKGLPIKVMIEEVNEHGELECREILGSYEDAYTLELKDMYECLVNEKKIKTGLEDAIQDVKLYDMMFRQWEKQESSQ